uniref:Conserved domain protein n=1 Tax=Strongyloides venezuelensis TaxID=75913 RepID=A0A0K0F3A7_STRVS
MTEVKENKPIYSFTVVYCPECAMPFEYCRENYFTQPSQEVVKDVEGFVITDNYISEENKHHKRVGV